MSRYTEKKPSYVSKDDFPVRFGFEYNESAINYRTEIPALPEKPKHRPDEKVKDKKVHEIDEKIQKLKVARKEKKDEIKKLNTEYDEEMDILKDHVTMGRKCILVLQFDIDTINEEISRKSGVIKKMQNKIEKLISEVKDIKIKNRPAKKVKKEYEEMNSRELEEEKLRIQQIMSTKTMTKKEEADLSALIYKIQRVKMEPNRKVQEDTTKGGENILKKIQDLEDEIAKTKEKESKVKAERLALFNEREELHYKIADIKQDIEKFFQTLKGIAQTIDSNNHNQQLTEESKAMKESIYKLREDIVKINSDFDEKIKEYEMEQEKIKWIGWATKIQEKKREEWEEEKAERKKQKAKEKAHTEKEGVKGKQGEKDGKDSKQVNEEKPAERKRLNRNQKEIDICAYLIDYCKSLYPTAENSGDKHEEKKEVNLTEALKKGPWVKEKGFEVIQSKKSKGDEEDTPKVKYNKKKHQKEQEGIVPTDRFSHDYFVAQSFDSVKILPPTNLEELEKIVKDLEDKVEYYLSHPNESVEDKFAKDKEYLSKAAQGDTRPSKYTKGRGSNKNIINTEEFPTL